MKHLAEMKERAENNLKEFGQAQGHAYYQIQYLAADNLKLISALEKCRDQRNFFADDAHAAAIDDAELTAILEGKES